MRDARILTGGSYRLTRLQPVDQFTWSAHLELAARFDFAAKKRMMPGDGRAPRMSKYLHTPFLILTATTAAPKSGRPNLELGRGAPPREERAQGAEALKLLIRCYLFGAAVTFILLLLSADRGLGQLVLDTLFWPHT